MAFLNPTKANIGVCVLSCEPVLLDCLHNCLSVTEWNKVWSRLSAHFQPFFSALTLYQFSTKTCCDKRYSYLTVLSLSGSLWLSVTPTLAPSGSNWLSQAFTGSFWPLLDLFLSLSGSLWLSVNPTLASTGSHCHSLLVSCPTRFSWSG